jgi:hypothetical protein
MLRINFLHLAACGSMVVVIGFVTTAFLASLAQQPTVELGAVNGRITFHGRPQSNLRVDFIPPDGGRGSEGRTDGYGRYRAFYTRDRAGVLLGHQQVLISVPEVFDSSQNITSPRKPLLSTKADVHTGANELDFDLAD